MTDMIKDEYDVVVIGGGAAGLSGALTLARSRRSVLVVDAGQPRNAPASGVHNFLTSEGISPSELVATGRSEVRGYGGHFVPRRVNAAVRTYHGFTVALDDGRQIRARRLLVTTGGVDELPDIPGVLERRLCRKADVTGLTAVPGVWVAGNVADPMATVIAAAAGGVKAAAAINADLVSDEAERAVAMNQVFDQAFWDERYRSQNKVWSGNPNPQLVSLVSGLDPGRALDVGSGEGADAIWLAERGWQVTAVDISAVALERAGVRAAEVGADVARRIDWVRTDLTEWAPDEGGYDLVSAQFMHLPKEPRESMLRGLAAAVAPGGCLLIVGHDPSDMQTTMPRPPMPELFFTAGEVADSLDPGAWEVLVCEARARQATDPEGRLVTIHDAVLLARRGGR